MNLYFLFCRYCCCVFVVYLYVTGNNNATEQNREEKKEHCTYNVARNSFLRLRLYIFIALLVLHCCFPFHSRSRSRVLSLGRPIHFVLYILFSLRFNGTETADVCATFTFNVTSCPYFSLCVCGTRWWRHTHTHTQRIGVWFRHTQKWLDAQCSVNHMYEYIQHARIARPLVELPL